MARNEDNCNRRIFLIPREVVGSSVEKDLEGRVESSLSTLSLRHPLTGGASKFFFDEKTSNIYEINSHRDKYGSWFVDANVQQDGSLFITTRFDPLYLLLPYLRNASKEGKFVLLDQILKDEMYPDCHKLIQCVTQAQLKSIAEVSGSGEFIGFRYSQEKTLSWLSRKVHATVQALKCTKIFIAPDDEDDKENEDVYLEYGFGVVSSYLSEEASGLLQKHLKIKKRAEKRHSTDHGNMLNAKKIKNEKVPDDAEKNNKKPTKMSKAQRELSKVDKKGMKSISSFFSPSAKKSSSSKIRF